MMATPEMLVEAMETVRVAYRRRERAQERWDELARQKNEVELELMEARNQFSAAEVALRRMIVAPTED